MYQQAVQPNLKTVGNIGWCLSFAENVFGTPHLYATATDGWHSTHFPHDDRNFPAGVSFPVWYSYIENGLDFGHVAVRLPDGRVLSSPYKAENTQQIFKDVDECARVLNCTYLGWSEDIATVQVIKEGPMMVDKNLLNNLYLAALNRQPDHPGADGFLGQPCDVVLQALLDSLEYAALQASRQAEAKKVDDLTAANLKLTAQIDALKAVPATPPDPQVTVTQSGLWAAFKKFLGL